jgi:hypothetical protein
MSSIDSFREEILNLAKKKEIRLAFSYEFDKQIKKIKDSNMKIKLFKQILKIIENTDIGKHMIYSRKGEQELYLDPFRIYYCFYKNEKILRFVEFSHKDEQ